MMLLIRCILSSEWRYHG